MVRECFMSWMIGALLASHGGASTVDATLRPVKPAFTAGEPIAIKLEITNSGPATIELELNYPTFQTADAPGLTLQLAAAAAPQEFLFPGGRVPLVPLAAGASWSTEVFLQRFVAAPGVGRKDISYRLEIPYSTGNERQKLLQSGKLPLLVAAADEEKLAAGLEPYGKRLESLNYWEQRSGIEALTLVTSPTVVPYLAKMLRAGFAAEALAALERFPAERGAQLAVLDALRSPQFGTVVRALGSLARWRFALADDELRGLARRDNSQIRLALVFYLEQVDAGRHVELMKMLAADADPAVAQRARGALEKLNQPG